MPALAEQVGLRKEIPPQMFRQLVAKASAGRPPQARARTPGAHGGDFQASVTKATGELYSKFASGQESYLALRQAVTADKAGRLNEKSILTYALAHKVEEAVIPTVSLLCSLPPEVVEEALSLNNLCDMILVLSKVLRISPGTPRWRCCSWVPKSTALPQANSTI